MPSAVILLHNANQLKDDDRNRFLACLSAGELLRYQRFLRPLRQSEFLLGRILLRFAVARLAGIAPDAVCVTERKNRAPLVQLPAANATNTTPAHFSLSHSRGWVACAVSGDTALGLDIETLDAERDVEAIGRAAFSEAESNWLSSRPAGDKVADFYTMWSSKEALFKLMSAQERATPSLEQVAVGVRLRSGPDWHARTWSTQGLAMTLCSRDRLQSVARICLHGDTPSAWSQQLGSH
ncbi:4'-phosphopantetheinyl transferase [Collimonas sp. OK607]|uniref:4'-phosphopantetheinyl transferase family protein n=1 Tax=Collimonas sp. OK607 TaxID=1798194 RepID=UPI0008E20690|nr:4'-phosphopantetheinyl transferase family protein [Collimonas sp. OK607]SFA70658.1 4'-phosphopantetheinyl transferase [Collimonas sp. OK607]